MYWNAFWKRTPSVLYNRGRCDRLLFLTAVTCLQSSCIPTTTLEDLPVSQYTTGSRLQSVRLVSPSPCCLFTEELFQCRTAHLQQKAALTLAPTPLPRSPSQPHFTIAVATSIVAHLRAAYEELQNAWELVPPVHKYRWRAYVCPCIPWTCVCKGKARLGSTLWSTTHKISAYTAHTDI